VTGQFLVKYPGTKFREDPFVCPRVVKCRMAKTSLEIQCFNMLPLVSVNFAPSHMCSLTDGPRRNFNRRFAGMLRRLKIKDRGKKGDCVRLHRIYETETMIEHEEEGK
jgi:hypothetical protein